jgi:peptide/nickel transport system ATP-binding protein/peptide/nickel transport system permease protein
MSSTAEARTTALPRLSLKRRAAQHVRFTTTRITAGIGLFLVCGLAFTAIFAVQLSPYDPVERVGRPFSSPSDNHPLGTNDIGQDILSELIYGARISLLVGVTAGLVTVIIGTTIGVLAGYFSRLGALLMRFTDVILCAGHGARRHHQNNLFPFHRS